MSATRFRFALVLTAMTLLTGCSSAGMTLLNGYARLGDYQTHQDIAYGPAPLQRLDVYVPNEADAEMPVVVFYYGGCWGACPHFSKENYRFVASTLTAHGYVVVVPDYRLYPDVHYNAIIADAAAALTWVHNNIARYDGDSRALFPMGHSSGAHLAIMLAVNQTHLSETVYASVKGAIGLAGPYDFLPFTADYMRELFGPEKDYPASQPVNFVDGSEPPLLLLHGSSDERVSPKNAPSLAEKVSKAGGTALVERYSGVGHTGILLAFSGLPFTEKAVLERVVEFLDLAKYSARFTGRAR